MQNTFDLWNELKKNIETDTNSSKKFPKEGDVWMTNFGKNIGFEQNGGGAGFSRPSLVVKKFNNNMFWGVPLSSKQKELNFYFNFTDRNNKKVSVILAQLKLLSIKRFNRKMYVIDTQTYMKIKYRIKTLF